MALDHVLICRTDNIGDVVLTLPLAGYLKSLNPSMKIGFVCRGYAADVARQCYAVDYVLEVERISDPALAFADLGVDAIIFAKPDRVLAKAARKARIAQRVGTSHRLFHWLTCNRLAHFSRVRSALHEVQLNFFLLRPLGIEFKPTLAQIPPLYQLDAPAYAGDIFFSHARFNVVIHPKSNGNGREWPLGHFAELARLLGAHKDICLWVTGSASEGNAMEQHAAGLFRQANVRNVCGKFALGQLAALISKADGVIASGTGPLHMAAALGQNALGLFPPTKPIHAGRWGGVGVRAQNLYRKQACVGCVGASTCQCMENITPLQVADIVLQWYTTKA